MFPINCHRLEEEDDMGEGESVRGEDVAEEEAEEQGVVDVLLVLIPLLSRNPFFLW
jgi:hypothetical protein